MTHCCCCYDGNHIAGMGKVSIYSINQRKIVVESHRIFDSTTAASQRVWLKWLNDATLAMVLPSGAVWHWDNVLASKPKEYHGPGQLQLSKQLANVYHIVTKSETKVRSIVGGSQTLPTSSLPLVSSSNGMPVPQFGIVATDRQTRKLSTSIWGGSDKQSYLGANLAWSGIIAGNSSMVLIEVAVRELRSPNTSRPQSFMMTPSSSHLNNMNAKNALLHDPRSRSASAIDHHNSEWKVNSSHRASVSSDSSIPLPSSLALPLAYRISLDTETDGQAPATLYLPAGDTVFTILVDNINNLLYIVTRKGMLALFRLPALERLLFEPLPLLSKHLWQIHHHSQPHSSTCQLPTTFDSITSVHLLHDPILEQYGAPPSATATATATATGTAAMSGPRVPLGLVLIDRKVGMFQVIINVNISQSSATSPTAVVPNGRTNEWRLIGSKSNALLEAANAFMTSPSMILLEQLKWWQPRDVLLFIFQDASGKLRINSVIQVIGAQEYSHALQQWKLLATPTETTQLVELSSWQQVQLMHSSKQIQSTPSLLLQLEKKHGDTVDAQDFLAQIAREADSPIRVIQHELKKWQKFRVSAGVNPLEVAISYVYQRHCRDSTPPPPPGIAGGYASQILHLQVARAEKMKLEGNARMPDIVSMNEERRQLFNSFWTAPAIAGATSPSSVTTTGPLTDAHRASITFFIIELLMTWALREIPRRKSGQSYVVDDTIVDYMTTFIQPLIAMDGDYISSFLWPLIHAFITGPDRVAALMAHHNTKGGPAVTGTAAASSDVLTRPTNMNSGDGNGATSIPPYFIPTWLRIVFRLYPHFPLIERRPVIRQHLDAHLLQILSSHRIPSILAELMQLCEEFTWSDLRPVAVFEPLFRDRSNPSTINLSNVGWTCLLKLKAIQSIEQSVDRSVFDACPSLNMWPIIDVAGRMGASFQFAYSAYQRAIRSCPDASSIARVVAQGYQEGNYSSFILLMAAIHLVTYPFKTGHTEMWRAMLSNVVIKDSLALQLQALYSTHSFWSRKNVADAIVVITTNMLEMSASLNTDISSSTSINNSNQSNWYINYIGDSLPLINNAMSMYSHMPQIIEDDLLFH
jgi:hypothetical protein